MTKDEDVQRVIGAAVDKFGHVDVVVNNAGDVAAGGLEGSSSELFNKMYDINVTSAFRMAKAARPHLIKSKGKV